MTELDLYKFITDQNVEWHWAHNDYSGNEDVVIFVFTFDLEDFIKILPDGIFEDDGLACACKGNYFCFWMESICEYSDIDMEDLFNKLEP